MPLVSTKEMFKKAYTGGYAIGAFNVNDMEILQGIVDAAKEEKGEVVDNNAGLVGQGAQDAHIVAGNQGGQGGRDGRGIGASSGEPGAVSDREFHDCRKPDRDGSPGQGRHTGHPARCQDPEELAGDR